MAFQASTFYQAWAARLRVPFLTGRVGRAVMGAFARVLGDFTLDWGTQANLEHLPEYASAPSVALTASERQIDGGPNESPAALATRITNAVQWWKFAGTPFGLLQALYFAGFGGAIIVTQNGVAYNLSAPPDSSNPSASLVITALGTNPGIPTVPPWWTFDTNNQFCSRFAVLFYGIPPGAALTHARATFTGVEDGSGAHPYPTLAWNNIFDDISYNVFPGTPIITDGSASVPGLVGYDSSTMTRTGVQTVASGPFVGYVDYIAAQQGANPYADLHANDLARIRSVIGKWRPAKATCMGIFICVQGSFCGWPVRNTAGATPGLASTVVSYSA